MVVSEWLWSIRSRGGVWKQEAEGDDGLGVVLGVWGAW